MQKKNQKVILPIIYETFNLKKITSKIHCFSLYRVELDVCTVTVGVENFDDWKSPIINV